MKPTRRPANPCFSSGPCAKRPGWSPAALEGALLGRSHRSRPGLARLVEIIERSRTILRMPEDYRLGIIIDQGKGGIPRHAPGDLLGVLCRFEHLLGMVDEKIIPRRTQNLSRTSVQLPRAEASQECHVVILGVES